MPSFNAHYLFAEHELDFIKKTFPEVKINEGALWYAAQGPDLFFFARLLPWMKGKNSIQISGSSILMMSSLHYCNMNLVIFVSSTCLCMIALQTKRYSMLLLIVR